MGRTSLLTDGQWHEITRRLLDFESCRALGREFNISEGAIRKRCSERNKEIRIVANMMLKAESAYRALTPAIQVAVCKRVAELKRNGKVGPDDGQALVATDSRSRLVSIAEISTKVSTETAGYHGTGQITPH